jgi:two-component system chemotaxis response regulator CheB
VSAKIKVLVVDDSAFMRMAVTRTIGSDPRIEVVGQARDGQDAVERAAELRPDVITMDYNMPRLNGAQAVRAILAARPIPVVMLSAHTVDGAEETVDALAAGAVDFVTKPSGEVSADLSLVKDELLRKIVAATKARPRSVPPPPAPAPKVGVAVPRDAPVPAAPAAERISFGSMALDPAVIVAISTGGPAALEQVVPRLPSDLAAGVLVVQHMPAHFTKALAKRLDRMSAVTVREARAQERLVRGVVLVAPGDKHVVVARNGALELTDGPPVNGCRPSADVTLQSAASVYGRKLTVVVMTGMGRDGATGAAAARAAGAKILAQDERTSVVYGMPRAVIEMNLADRVIPLPRIPEAIARAGA